MEPLHAFTSLSPWPCLPRQHRDPHPADRDALPVGYAVDAAQRATTREHLTGTPDAYAVVRFIRATGRPVRHDALIGYAPTAEAAIDAAVRLTRHHGAPGVTFEATAERNVPAALVLRHAADRLIDARQRKLSPATVGGRS